MRRVLRLLAAIRCEHHGHRHATVVKLTPAIGGDGRLRLDQIGHEHTCLRCKATLACPGGAA